MSDYKRPEWIEKAPERYQTVFELHDKWLKVIEGGERADLQNADLQDANFRYADLRHANFRHANFQNANFQNANLQNANFQNAYLWNVNFQNANLQEAYFQNAYLRYADLQGAYLRDAIGILTIFPIGSRGDQIVANVREGAIRLKNGCFYGGVEEFLAAVEKQNGDSKIAREYRAAVELIKIKFEEEIK
jgi:hypothetical protein